MFSYNVVGLFFSTSSVDAADTKNAKPQIKNRSYRGKQQCLILY